MARAQDSSGGPRVYSPTTAAAFAVGAAFALATGKLVVAAATGALSVWASFGDSCMDVAASGINYCAIRAARAPADREHRFGHGKFESLAGIFQAGVVAAAGVFLAAKSIERLLIPRAPEQLEMGVAVMLLSTLGSLLIVIMLRQAAARTGSLALEADSLHYATDIITNAATAGGLALVRWTGRTWLDPVLALALTVYLLVAAFRIFRRALDILADRELPPEERRVVEAILQESAPPEVIAVRRVRTRTSGHTRFVEARVEIAVETTFARAHEITESLASALVERFDDVEVIIHADPSGVWDHVEPPPLS